MMLFLLIACASDARTGHVRQAPADVVRDTGAVVSDCVHVVGLQVVELPVYVQDDCDGIDSDADGAIDEDGRVLWLSDPDGVGCGYALPVAMACDQPYGMALPCEGLAWP